jgi:hypothetical protein
MPEVAPSPSSHTSDRSGLLPLTRRCSNSDETPERQEGLSNSTAHNATEDRSGRGTVPSRQVYIGYATPLMDKLCCKSTPAIPYETISKPPPDGIVITALTAAAR